jgi:Tol biopolymer transport system component
VIRSIKTGEERTAQLPARAISRFGAGPKWFGDNRSVLVETADAQGSGFGFYRLTIETGNAERLVSLPSIVSSYDVTPDGRSIVYAVFTSDAAQTLVRFDVESRRETVLGSGTVGAFQLSREIIALAVSPDGTQIGATMMGGVFEVVPISGGASREVFRPAAREVGTGTMLQGLTWARDQRSLLAVRADGFLWRIPVNGGAPEKIDISNAKSPSLHPDGKRLVFHRGNGANTSKVWALDQVVAGLKPSR